MPVHAQASSINVQHLWLYFRLHFNFEILGITDCAWNASKEGSKCRVDAFGFNAQDMAVSFVCGHPGYFNCCNMVRAAP